MKWTTKVVTTNNVVQLVYNNIKFMQDEVKND